jgi:hypothetical protein
LFCVGVGGMLLGLVLEVSGFTRMYLPRRPSVEHGRLSIFGLVFFGFGFGLVLFFFLFIFEKGDMKRRGKKESEEEKTKSLQVALVKENSTKE